MKLLAWDTSSKSGAIVAMEWDPREQGSLRLAAEWSLNVEVTHSERLLWGIDQVLEAARWKLDEVDHLGVGVGPGSFTGIRIGVTTARTLGHLLKKPVVRVSSLAALARPAALWLAGTETKAVVVAATDAAKGELFALWGNARSVMDCVCLADGDLGGVWKRGVEEQVLAPERLIKSVLRKLHDPIQKAQISGWIALGEGRKRYPEAWKLLPAARELAAPAPFGDYVQGRYLGLLAWEAVQAGIGAEALSVHPRYLRASDAELKLKAGLLPPGPTR